MSVQTSCTKLNLPLLSSTVHTLRCAVQDELWIIDVSQAVDLDHPRALDFLKEDAAHINTFFRRAGIAVLTTRQLFDFAVDPSINESNLHEAVQTLQQLAVRYTALTKLQLLYIVPWKFRLPQHKHFRSVVTASMKAVSRHCKPLRDGREKVGQSPLVS